MSVVLVILSAVLLCAWIYYYNTYWKKKNVPSIKESSILKSLEVLFLRTAIWKHIEDLYWKYDDKFTGFFMLHTPSLLVKDLKLVKHVCLKDFDHFPDRTLGRNPSADKLGAHILFLTTGQEWKFMRTKVVPAYSTSRINMQIPLMSAVSKNLCDYLARHENQPVDVSETCARYSTDVITTSAYGIDANSFAEKEEMSYRSITAEIFPPTTFRALQFSTYYVAPFLVKYLGMTFLNTTANKLLEKTYVEQMNKKMETQTSRGDFLDFIIQLCKKESDPRFNIDSREMISQAAQYFLAGYETIGSIFSYMLYELAKHQDVQSRLREEIRSVMENHGSFTTTAIKEMTYLEMTLRETLRLYPVLPFLDRKLVKDYQLPDTNVTIDKGTNVYISVIGMHYDPQYFPDPHKFDPERFSAANKDKIEPFTYLPFGAGPRICIGARYGVTTIKTAIVNVLQKFNVSTCPQTCKEIKYFPTSFVLIPTKNIQLTFNKI